MLSRTRVPHPHGASFSSAVVVETADARWIYVSGQTLRDEPDRPVPADVGEQTDLCFGKIDDVLGECGATMADVTQITVYLTDLSDYASVAEARARAFADELPSSAAVGVSTLLGDSVVEISAVAVVARARD